MKLIIDCDTGIDDALALLYAVASSDAELIAVTCTAGNIEARQVAENTRALLELRWPKRCRGRARAGSACCSAADDRARDSRPARNRLRAASARGDGVSARHSADLIIAEARRAPVRSRWSRSVHSRTSRSAAARAGAATTAARPRDDGRLVSLVRQHRADFRMERRGRPRGDGDCSRRGRRAKASIDRSRLGSM